MNLLRPLAPALLLIPLVVLLAQAGLTVQRPIRAALGVLGVGLVTAWVVGGLVRAGRLPSPLSLLSSRAGLALSVLLAAVYGAVLSRFHLIHHQNLRTATWDLGIYVSTLWNTSRGDWFACSLLTSGTDITAHFEPILIPISALMWLDSGVEALLIFQSFWIGLGALPLYLLAQHHLRSPAAGVVLSLAWVLHPALHGFNMFDFHTLSLVGPIVLWCLLFLERGQAAGYLVALAVLLSAREDMPLLAAFIGLYAISAGRRRLGAATVAASVLYFVVVKQLVMTGAASYSSYFAELEMEGRSIYASIFLSAVTRPLFVLQHVLEDEKIAMLLQLSVPLLLLPWLVTRRWLMYLYGLAILLLASKPAVFSIQFQYVNLLLPFLFAATPPAIRRLREGRLGARVGPEALTVGLLSGVLAASLALSALYGAFVQNDAFRPGARAFHRAPTAATRARWDFVAGLREQIPDDAAVVVSGRLGPHFSMRASVWQFRKRQRPGQDPDYYIVLENDSREGARREKLDRLRARDDLSLIADEHGILVFEAQ